MARPLKILYVGPDYAGSNGTLWRNAFVRVGCEVRTVDDEQMTAVAGGLWGRIRRRLSGRRPTKSQLEALNHTVLEAAGEFRPDLTFYIKAPYIIPETLAATKAYGPVFAYMNDDMFLPGIHTFTFRDNVKLFDCILTTKSFSVREYMAAGASWAIYIPNSYDPAVHFPISPSKDERDYFGCDVAFIGDFSPSKADALARIAAHPDEMTLNVWGNWTRLMRLDNWPDNRHWRQLGACVRGQSLYCADMGKAIGASKISLGLLRRESRDLHTSRSFEIPACAGFMLAHRTEEHRMYFEEDKEAVYFSSPEELMDKLRFYLGHSAARERIAVAGYQRCLRSKATYVDRAYQALECFMQLRPTAAGSGRIPKGGDYHAESAALKV